MDITEGKQVKGIDIYGNKIPGKVESIMKTFGMAQVRFSKDRLGITTCSISKIKALKNNK